MGGDGVWHLVVLLSPWRRPDGLIEKNALRVEHVVGTSSNLRRYMSSLKKGSVVRVSTSRVRPPREGSRWWDCAKATQLEKISWTRELEEAQRELDRAVVVRDPLLGRLVLDREYHAFRGRRVLAGRRYALGLDQALESDPVAHVASMQSRVLAFERQYQANFASVLAWVFNLYNDNWRGERAALTSRKLASRLRLTSVQVDTGDRTTAYFSAGDLFLGHDVEVRLGPRAGIREIGLVG